ncbi:hypothetical protein HHK36_000829 [Tetracentron sinense]|uniref:PGG domain-containing protein n=1 Tax=Tetracentron sinense TaxID=13715 RepID=A0A834ZUU8_TETSI|nr:hypothetical protein HHK36_000829 [Tetracentron sinense]
MDQRLTEAAREGDIDALYALIHEDPFILEKIDQVPFIDTPLHIAVSAGKNIFAMEIANLKPSFLKKLNQDGLSPIHLASTKVDPMMMKELLTIGRELCLLKGREKRTPLHVAVIFGRIDVINELMNQFPKSLEELTVHKETVLHLALKYEQFDTFKLLLNWVRELNRIYIVNLKDDEGNTVLHYATSKALPQIIKDLVRIYSVRVKVNTMNANNRTALDVLLQLPGENREIEDILRRAKAKKGDEIVATSPPLTSQQSRVVSKISRPLRGWKAQFRRVVFSDYSIEVRSALLVVAVLTATATFQTGVTPPGGVWQDNFHPVYNNVTNTNTTIFSHREKSHKAGTAIMFTNLDLFTMFTFCNVSGFLISVAMIFIFTAGLPFSNLVRLALAFMGLTYVLSLMTTIPGAGYVIPNILMGREKRTPLHVAVIFGRIDVINELINQFPKSLEELTIHKETVLHLALKYQQFDTFKLLLDWVRELNRRYILNLKDNEGNTVLHLATSRALPQANLRSASPSHFYFERVEVNTVNANNQTALDVLLQLPGENGEIKDILRRAKAKRGDEIISPSRLLTSDQIIRVVSKIPRPLRDWKARFRRVVFSDYSIEVRSALLVVAVLTATATFQTGVNPPGGMWQDDFHPGYNNVTNTNTTTTTIFSPREMSHKAGTAIMSTNFDLFIIFTFCNVFGF